ncbi:hypothetical protein NL676_003025 [Syzygium grande]|nr:hypothetical protein NL676_003025 [Syzygium grande]
MNMELVLACWNAEMRGMGSQAQASVQWRDDGVDNFHHSVALSEHVMTSAREIDRVMESSTAGEKLTMATCKGEGGLGKGQERAGRRKGK